ncbi:O-acetylhomoserine ami [Lentinula edodes]|uniref:O-acetylhomoserine ami n=1 Tax=Lentinula edodes TaxID=5353 RepID=A0A1Q3E219_LENED|nr:O-acetylhomoserine ami [Lentinula edodes]
MPDILPPPPPPPHISKNAITSREPGFETRQLHAGYDLDITSSKSRAVPIFATTSFVFRDTDHAASVFGMETPGFAYSRMSNPTVDVFEKRIAALEGGFAAVGAASGQAAGFMAIATLAATGDNVVSSANLFGGTFIQFKYLFKKFGITFKFITDENPESYDAAVDERTKAIFVESIVNPTSKISPLPSLSKIAQKHKIPFIVDNTCGAGGYVIRPFDHGADIIVTSATKYLGGHGTTIGGCIIDSGKFDWVTSGKFPGLTEPSDPSHGIKFVDQFGQRAFTVKLRMEILRDLETFGECFGACKVAREASEIMRPNVFGGILSFGVKGDPTNGKKTVDKLKLASLLSNIGDSKTLVIHPASTTHGALSPKELSESGVTADLIRVCVGTESIEDIIGDFSQAIDAVFPHSRM